MIAPGDGQLRILGQRGAGLVDAPAGHCHQPGDDQRLRLRPTLREAAIDEQLVGAPFRHVPIRKAFPRRIWEFRDELTALAGRRCGRF